MTYNLKRRRKKIKHKESIFGHRHKTKAAFATQISLWHFYFLTLTLLHIQERIDPFNHSLYPNKDTY